MEAHRGLPEGNARLSRRIVNLSRVRPQRWRHGRRYDARIAWIAERLGAKALGFNVTVLPPGKSAFPFHLHHMNEEMFFVLDGRGTIRIGARRFPIRKGDFISLPAGLHCAHQILNTSRRPLRYLAVSTMTAPDVAEYPDSGRFGVFTGSAPGRTPRKGHRRVFLPERSRVGYWDGEEG